MKIETIGNLLEENKDCYYCTIIRKETDNLIYHCPMFSTDLHSESAYNEILGTGYWSYLKNRIVQKYIIDTDFGESRNKTRIKIYI